MGKAKSFQKIECFIRNIFNSKNNREKQSFFLCIAANFPFEYWSASAYKNEKCFDMGFIYKGNSRKRNREQKHTTLFQFPSTYQSLELAKVRQQFNKNKETKTWNSVDAFVWSMALLAVLCPFAYMSDFNVIIIWTYPLSTCHRQHKSRTEYHAEMQRNLYNKEWNCVENVST